MTEPFRYIGFCCREWILAVGGNGSCGICGEVPEFLRAYDPDRDGRPHIQAVP